MELLQLPTYARIRPGPVPSPPPMTQMAFTFAWPSNLQAATQ